MDEYVFPQDHPDGAPGKARSGGLGLRDYFASKAPPMPWRLGTNPTTQDLANWSYDYADAMMVRRQEGK